MKYFRHRYRGPHREVAGGKHSYDYLIVASGATHAYFGHDGGNLSHPASRRSRTREIRRRVLLAFELAERKALEGQPTTRSLWSSAAVPPG